METTSSNAISTETGTAPKSIDLDALIASRDELIDVPFLFDRETGDPTAGFRIVGADSDRWQQAERRIKQKNFRSGAARRAPLNVASQTGAKELEQTIHEDEVALAVAVVVEMYGFTSSGSAVDLSEAQLRKIFAAKPTWVTKLLAEGRAARGFS